MPWWILLVVIPVAFCGGYICGGIMAYNKIDEPNE